MSRVHVCLWLPKCVRVCVLVCVRMGDVCLLVCIRMADVCMLVCVLMADVCVLVCVHIAEVCVLECLLACVRMVAVCVLVCVPLAVPEVCLPKCLWLRQRCNCLSASGCTGGVSARLRGVAFQSEWSTESVRLGYYNVKMMHNHNDVLCCDCVGLCTLVSRLLGHQRASLGTRWLNTRRENRRIGGKGEQFFSIINLDPPACVLSAENRLNWNCNYYQQLLLRQGLM